MYHWEDFYIKKFKMVRDHAVTLPNKECNLPLCEWCYTYRMTEHDMQFPVIFSSPCTNYVHSVEATAV